MVKVLLTAFEPFGKDVENAAAIVCEKIPSVGTHYQMEKRILPTEFAAGAETLLAAIDETCPEMVICLGQAGGRAQVTPERVAVNLMDGSIPDNGGYQPDEIPIIPDGPTAYLTNVPIKAVVQQAREAGYPVQISNSAGLYVCNCVFYTLMNRIAYTPANEAAPALWGGFYPHSLCGRAAGHSGRNGCIACGDGGRDGDLPDRDHGRAKGEAK